MVSAEKGKEVEQKVKEVGARTVSAAKVSGKTSHSCLRRTEIIRISS